MYVAQIEESSFNFYIEILVSITSMCNESIKSVIKDVKEIVIKCDKICDIHVLKR